MRDENFVSATRSIIQKSWEKVNYPLQIKFGVFVSRACIKEENMVGRRNETVLDQLPGGGGSISPVQHSIFVWTQQRTNFSDAGDFNFGRDFKNLISSAGDNVFIIKASYW